MLSIDNLSNLEANLHACFYQEQDGRNLSNDCGTVCLFLSSSYLLGHVSLKYHFPSNTNRVNYFVVAVNRKISPFFTPNGINVQGVHYIWYQSQVETLGTKWAQNAPTCFTLELPIY